MSLDKLVDSYPTMSLDTFLEYITSLFILITIPSLFLLLFLSISLIRSSREDLKFTFYDYFTFSIPVIILSLGLIGFYSYQGLVDSRSEWVKNELHEYLDNTYDINIVKEDNIIEYHVRKLSNYDKATVSWFKEDGSKVRTDRLDLYFEAKLKEPYLSYVVVEEDIKDIKGNILVGKGELMNMKFYMSPNDIK